MIYRNEKTNLLEEKTQVNFLHDVDEPNLIRDLYDYNSIPKISFNNMLVPMDMPKELYITDTTFRDGQQSTSPFTIDQIVRVFQYLHKLGGENGIIRQSEFFLYSEKDRKAVEKCKELGYEFPEITSWIRANKKDFELVKSMGIKETGILTHQPIPLPTSHFTTSCCEGSTYRGMWVQSTKE